MMEALSHTAPGCVHELGYLRAGLATGNYVRGRYSRRLCAVPHRATLGSHRKVFGTLPRVQLRRPVLGRPRPSWVLHRTESRLVRATPDLRNARPRRQTCAECCLAYSWRTW